MTTRPNAYPTLFGVLLIVALVLTGQGMAFARGQAPAEGTVVLCTGHGALMVYTDADGAPTSPPQLCADGALALFVALVGFGPDVPVLLGAMRSARVLTPWGAVGRLTGTARARGPPVL